MVNIRITSDDKCAVSSSVCQLFYVKALNSTSQDKTIAAGDKSSVELYSNVYLSMFWIYCSFGCSMPFDTFGFFCKSLESCVFVCILHC